MKVYIGPYKDWFGPHQLCEYLRYLGVPEDLRYKIAERLPIGPFNLFDKLRGPRKVKVRIDRYDTWSMDSSLALIIHPMLIQLKKTKHGSPFVDDEDVPEHLRSTAAPPKENEWDTDAFHHDRWNYVLDEMIYTFGEINNEGGEDKFYSGETDWKFEPEGDTFRLERGPNHTFKIDVEGMIQYHGRIRNGFRLFGKYYQNLWD